MVFERIVSKGIAHYSYILGDRGQACVVDPRRDCEVYAEIAEREGLRITTILETHRNEDYVVGSTALAARTGARVWHADGHLDYQYGFRARTGQIWTIGALRILAIPSPGHTQGSMSYAVHLRGGAPWILFSGDALFAGDVGRVDFLGEERLEEMARKLHDTLFRKLLPLGDGVILCPAHGSGSVCGSSIASRTWTTLGLERSLNPRLQLVDKDDFVAQVGISLPKAPYFHQMEKMNLGGGGTQCEPAVPQSLSPRQFATLLPDAVVVDTRCPSCFAAAHVPGAIGIPEEEIPAYAGWFLPYDKPLLLVSDSGDANQAARHLFRLGYDRVAGVLGGCIKAWHSAGHRSGQAGIVDPVEFSRLVQSGERMWVLDVRSPGELVTVAPVPGAHRIHITEIAGRIGEVPRDQPVYVICATGTRATIVSSLLLRAGISDVTIVMGGMVGLARAKMRSRTTGA